MADQTVIANKKVPKKSCSKFTIEEKINVGNIWEDKLIINNLNKELEDTKYRIKLKLDDSNGENKNIQLMNLTAKHIVDVETTVKKVNDMINILQSNVTEQEKMLGILGITKNGKHKF